MIKKTKTLVASGLLAVATVIGTAGFAQQAEAPALVSTMPAAGTYKIDDTHAQVRMTWYHMGLSRPGATFEKVNGTIVIDPANPDRSSVDVVIAAASVDSGVPLLDTDFLSAKFFDVAKYPTITFKSREVRTTGLGRDFTVLGDLTVKGVTKPVTLHATLNGAGVHPMMKVPTAGFSATTTIKRSDFGMGQFVPLVSDDLDVNITVEAVKS
nr:YceI family protein [uncultured Sphingomonas sp.]